MVFVTEKENKLRITYQAPLTVLGIFPLFFSKLEIEKQAHNLIPNLLLSCIHFYPNKLFSFRATIIIMMIKIIIFENFLWLSNIS